MYGKLRQHLDALKLAKKLIGKTENITIDSNIFKHNFNWDNVLNEDEDIIEIFGNDDKEIELDDIIDAFTEMQKQFEVIKKYDLDGRSYAYEGIKYNGERGVYEILWGS